MSRRRCSPSGLCSFVLSLALATNVFGADPIRVGLIFSETGTMRTSEQPLEAAALVAIEEINAAGGILGRPVQAILRDGASDPVVAAGHAERLIKEEGVVAIFGCWTSSCRKAVVGVVESLHGVLFYPVQNEGTGLRELPLDPSPQVVYAGAAPNQQLVPAVYWALDRKPRARVFLIGSDYTFPRSANALLRAIVSRSNGTIVGEEYQPLGAGDFRDVVARIERSRPDVILNTVNGLDNSTLFNELSRVDPRGDKYLTISFSVEENLTDEVGWGRSVGRYAAWNYFHDPANPRAQNFMPQFRARLGSDAARTSDPVEASYLQTHIFALAARRANSLAPNEVLRATRGLVLEGFSGLVRVDPVNQNLWKKAVVGRFTADRRLFEPVWTSDYLLAPEPAPQATDPDLRTRAGFGTKVSSGDQARHMLSSASVSDRVAALAFMSQHANEELPLAQLARNLASPANWTEHYLAARALVRNGSPDAQRKLADALGRTFDDNDTLLLLTLITEDGGGLRHPLTRELADAITATLTKSTDPVVRAVAVGVLAEYPTVLAERTKAVLAVASRGDAAVAVAALQAFRRLPSVSVSSALHLVPILERTDLASAPGLADAACAALDAVGRSWEADLPVGGIPAYREISEKGLVGLGAGKCPRAEDYAKAIERHALSAWLASYKPDSLTGWMGLITIAAAALFVLTHITRFMLVMASPGRFMRKVRPFRSIKILGANEKVRWFAEIANLVLPIARSRQVLNRWIVANRTALGRCSVRVAEGEPAYQYLLVEDEIEGNKVRFAPDDAFFASLLTDGGAAQILGEGGAGKTTFAIQLLRVAKKTRVARREVIPVFLHAHEIGDVEKAESIVNALQRKLADALREERRLDNAVKHELDDSEMTLTLLRRGHIVLVIDDLTRAVNDQWALAASPDFRGWFPCIFYTGRRPIAPAIVRTVTPQPIDKAGILSFVEAQVGGLSGAERTELEERLEALFAWRARVPALFARLIAERVVAERNGGPALVDLDLSIPELVIAYVARVLDEIPRHQAASIDSAQAWRALGALSWACLEHRLSVTAIPRERVLEILAPFGEPESTLRAISEGGRLAHRVDNGRVAMASDALAEYLAALWAFDASAKDRWEKEVQPRISELLEFRTRSQRVDEPARTFFSALLDVAERANSSSTGSFEHLSASTAAIATIEQWLDSRGHTKPPIRVGVLFSSTGAMAISEGQLQDATMLAIERVNARGGVRGRRIVAEIRNGASDPATFARMADELVQSGVVSIFGCWTSASRIEVLRVFEKRREGLLFYPVQYEGYEASPYALYFGAAPNQQLLPAVDWCIEQQQRRRFLLIGSDYVFPRIANEILMAKIRERAADGAVLLRDPIYVDLEEPSFDDAFEAIDTLKPDVVLNTINGAGNLEFFWRLWEIRRGGISDLRVMSFSIGDHEAQRIGIEVSAGHFASWNYFATLGGHPNSVFLRGMRSRKHVFFPSDPAEAAYTQVLAFAKAAEGVLDSNLQLTPAAVRQAALGLELEAPSGRIRIDPENGHLHKIPRIGCLQSDGTFGVIWTASGPEKPEPFPFKDLNERVQKIRAELHPPSANS